MGGAEIWLSLKNAAQGSHGELPFQKIPTVPQKYEIAQNNKISLEYMQLFILLNESKAK